MTRSLFSLTILFGVLFSQADAATPWAWTSQTLNLGSAPQLVTAGTSAFGTWVSNGIVQGAKANGPSWSEFKNLSTTAIVPNSYKIAANASGAATIAWESTDGFVHTSQYVQGNWTADKVISPPATAAGVPALIVDGMGNVSVTWVTRGGVVQAIRQSNGEWGAVATLTSSSTTASINFAPQIAVDSNGIVTIAWLQQSGGVAAAQYTFGWGLSSTISGSATVSVQPLLTIDSSNTPTVAWTTTSSSVQASRLVSNAWSVPATIGSGTARFLLGAPNSNPSVVLDNLSVSQYSQQSGWQQPVTISYNYGTVVSSTSVDSATVDSSGNVSVGYVIVSFRGSKSAYVGRFTGAAWQEPFNIIQGGAMPVAITSTPSGVVTAVSANSYIRFANGTWSQPSTVFPANIANTYPIYNMGSDLTVSSDANGNVYGLASGFSSQSTISIDSIYGTYNNYQLSINCNNPGLTYVTSMPLAVGCSGSGSYGYSSTSNGFFAADSRIKLSSKAGGTIQNVVVYSGACNASVPVISAENSCAFNIVGASSVSIDMQNAPLTDIKIINNGPGYVTGSNYPFLCASSKCSIPVVQGLPLTLKATADQGYTFVGWSGDCTGMASTCTFIPTTNSSVTTNNAASYPAPNVTLAVSVAGPGTVTSNPAGINCGQSCKYKYTKKMSVTLTATPAAGKKFFGWSRGCAGRKSSCKVRLTGTKSVKARFK